MILLIDNYDSFTWNLVHFLGELGAECEVVRNDQLTVDEALTVDATAVILSPGPCAPDTAGICVDLIKNAPETLPILGVCLGHQSIGAAFGATVGRCPEVLHGKISGITHEDCGVFRGLDQGFEATRYHSLAIVPDTVPDCLQVTAQSNSGVIMGVQHRDRPIHGVQFHPESIRTQGGHDLLRNFLNIAEAA